MNRERRVQIRGARASALLLVLWCVAVLSVVILASARMVASDVDDESLQNRRFEARELALTGVALGMHPRIEVWDPLFDQRWPDGRKLRVRVVNESARLDINRLLRERGQTTLRRLFEIWGVKSEDISVAVDSMVDWTDKNTLRSLNGAEREDLAGQNLYSLPANRDFRAVAEMERVRGMDAIAQVRPDWANFFTVYGGRRIDLQDASIDVLRAAGGLSVDQAKMIEQVRNGADRVPKTIDDVKIKSVPEFARSIGVSGVQLETIQARFSVNSGPTRIESVATVGGVDYTILVIASRTGSDDSSLIYWEER